MSVSEISDSESKWESWDYLSDTVEKLRENGANAGWDRTLLHYSSMAAEPLCKGYELLRYRLVTPLDPKEFTNCSTETREIAFRGLIVAGAIASLALFAMAPLPVGGMILLDGVACKTLRALGNAIQKDGFTHVRGKSPEKNLTSAPKVMTWNVCGIAGGFGLDHGGVVDWRLRLDAIVKQIREEDPDVLALQEIYDTAFGEALIERLQDRYAHFYTHIGPSSFLGSEAGNMIMTKYPVHRFTSTSCSDNSWTLNRSYQCLEIKKNATDNAPCLRIMEAHLIHYDNDFGKKTRAAEIAEMTNSLAQKTICPTIFMGDFNIQRDSEEGKQLRAFLDHSYIGEKPTCTNGLLRKWDPDMQTWNYETIDYISLVRKTAGGVTLAPARLVEAHDSTYNTRTARSDHNGLITEVQVLA